MENESNFNLQFQSKSVLSEMAVSLKDDALIFNRIVWLPLFVLQTDRIVWIGHKIILRKVRRKLMFTMQYKMKLNEILHACAIFAKEPNRLY